MTSPISIYEAKTQLSKLINQVKEGKEVVIGSYGKPEVMLVPYKKTSEFILGVWDSKGSEIDFDALEESDVELAAEFDKSLNKGLDE